MNNSIKILSELNLNVRVLKELEDPHAPPGTILSQSPKSETYIKQHQIVYVTISKKPNLLLCPNLVGKNVTEINKCMQLLGLKAKFHFISHNQFSDICIAQIPTQNSPLEAKTVELYIASPQKKLSIMPDIRGCSLQDVQDAFKSLSLSIHVMNEKEKMIKNTKIIDQKPLPGTMVNFSQPLSLFVQLE